jgi:hypothetical protein
MQQRREPMALPGLHAEQHNVASLSVGEHPSATDEGVGVKEPARTGKQQASGQGVRAGANRGHREVTCLARAYSPSIAVCYGILAGCPGGVQDQLGHLLRMSNQREVTGVDLDRCGVHALGEEALKLRRDRAVLPRDGIPGWFRPPGRHRGLFAEECF